ncbi:DUF488 family protein [Bosea sp. F3-2]|jgi:uncharacterized protein YeaO (DUF488 family)|uniref:DUF488 domain-containing protein n=1 Tax=Bosea sp. F3-2 TaxID=2599640 RepID=UPI0011ECC13A|nr:DUF488 family protein [Bosea sp. F3-2]QEL21217.1 DUF488 family protein [Bosea sp. F3-2]
MSQLTVKRVYDPPAPGDGMRILVDRLWPRGVSKDRIDLWLKEIAPSDTLRHEFHGHPDRWDEFRAAYAAELGTAPAQAALATLDEKLKEGPVTLLYAAKDEHRNNAEALRLWLAERAGSAKSG